MRNMATKGSMCVSCCSVINKSQKSIACDFCMNYTHINCDKQLTLELCTLLDKNPSNSLVYLCTKCKPILLPSADVLGTISQKIQEVCKTKIIDFKVKQGKSLDFLVTKSNALEESLQSLKLLLGELMETNNSGKSYANAVTLGYTGNESRESVPKSTDSTTSMVLYNVPNSINDTLAVLELAGTCYVNKRDIVKTARLSSSRSSSPIVVSLVERNSMWNFLKTINALKPHGVYARPFLEGTQLKNDKELMKNLKALRHSHPDKRFKIYRGMVVEELMGQYITWFKV